MGTINNFFDEVVSLFSPKVGFKRAANRVRMETMKSQLRRYEGAADGRRHSSWLMNSNPSVNQVIKKDLTKLVNRSRELSINTGYGKKAPFDIANNVIGTGIVATPYIVDNIVNGEIKQLVNKEKIEKAAQIAFNEWAEDISCDYNGDNTFYGLQHLAVRTIVISGEILVIRKRVPVGVNKYGFQLLFLEGDFIDTSKHVEKTSGGGYIFYGIEYDSNNKKKGYYIFDRHPSESKATSDFIKIEDIIHVFDIERTGQNRGVPFSSSTMVTQRDLSDYMDAELVAKKAASCFAAFVQKDTDPEGGGDQDSLIEELEPGSVQYLNAGETIQFPTLPQNPGLKDFVSVQHRGIAAGYLMPYETLTGDFSNVNFSSGRLGQLSFQRQIAYWQFTMFIPRFADKIFSWFVQGFKIAQSIPSDVSIKAKWTAPRREMIDPGKEIKAMKEEVRAGFSSWSEKVRENGYDPATVLKELTEDQKKFIEAGLMPDWTQFFELNAKVQMNAGKEEKKKAD